MQTLDNQFTKTINRMDSITQQVVLFGRVSSTNERQSFERQINDLTQLAATQNYHVAGVFAEKISGATKNAARKELLNIKVLPFVRTEKLMMLLLS